MNRSMRWTAVAMLSVVAMLAVGASGALAHRGGPGGKGGFGASAGTLVTQAATQLNVTRARLVDAIEDAAVARIDEAVADGDLESADAAELKEEARDNLRYAIELSRTRVVASNLGITTAALNTGFRNARKAVALARIAEALEDGDIEAAEATELRAEVNEATFPGYKAPFGRGHRGIG